MLNLEVMIKFEEQVHQYDISTLLQVPAVYRDIVAQDAWEARWDDSNPYCEIVDLTLHWESCRWTKSSSGSVTLMFQCNVRP